jgi:hypothetical protein
MGPKTWRIGTIKAVEVETREVFRKDKRGRPLPTPFEALSVLCHATHERFILQNTGWHHDAKPGDTGIITLVAANPVTRVPAHWVYTPDAKRED